MTNFKNYTMQAAQGNEQIAGWVIQWTYNGKVKRSWMPGATEAWARYAAKQVAVVDWCLRYTEVDGKRIILA